MKFQKVAVVIAAVVAACGAGAKKVNHTISLDADGGTVAEDTVIADIFDTKSLPNPVKDHYVFTGWYDDNDTLVRSINHPVKSETLTAHYVPETLFVQYKDGDTIIGEQSFRYGESISIWVDGITVSNHPYEDFKGWVDTSGNAVTVVPDDQSDDFVVTASYSGKTYSINYDLDGGTADNPETYTFGTETTLNDASKSGYTFDGWFNDAGDKIDKVSADSNGDLHLTAHYSAVKQASSSSYSSSYSGTSASSKSSYSGGSSYSSNSGSSSTSHGGNYIKIGRYSANLYEGSDAQAIIDAHNSAWIQVTNKGESCGEVEDGTMSCTITGDNDYHWFIADHAMELGSNGWFHNFDVLDNLSPGATAYVSYNGESRTLTMVARYLVNSDTYSSAWDHIDEGDVMMQTCANEYGDGWDWMTIWR